MTSNGTHGLFQSACHINRNVSQVKALPEERLAESATAALMTGSSSAQRSVFLDNGEFFFDDDFSVPFDLNLREENNNVEPGSEESSQSSVEEGNTELSVSRSRSRKPVLSGSASNLGLVNSRSDSCLYQSVSSMSADAANNLEAMDEEEEEENEEEVIDDYDGLSDIQTDPLFTPPSGSELVSSMRMSGSSMERSGLGTLRTLLSRHRPSPADYQLTFGTQQEFPQPVNDSTTTSGGSQMSTWASLAGSRKKFASQQDLSTSRNLESSRSQMTTWGQVKRTTLIRANSQITTWKQMKAVVGVPLVSWQKLKSFGRKSESPCSTSVGVSVVNMRGRSSARDALQTVRARSESPDKHREMQRFSGTLLELYKRANINETSKTTAASIACETEYLSRPPSTVPRLLRANVLLGVSPSEEDAQPLNQATDKQNFGSQFPSPSEPLRSQSVGVRRSESCREPQQRSRSSTPVGSSHMVNNNKRIAYPGLGVMSVPRASRLQGTAFLSRTLPDLSFLSRVVEEQKSRKEKAKKQAAVTPGDSGFESNNDASTRPQRPNWIPICRKCGCTSDLEGSPTPKAEEPPVTFDLIQLDENAPTCAPCTPLTKYQSVPDLLTQDWTLFEEKTNGPIGLPSGQSTPTCTPINICGSPVRRFASEAHLVQSEEAARTPPLKSCLVQRPSAFDRSTSEPNALNEILDREEDHSRRQYSIQDSTSSQEEGSEREFRAKKSVSFSETILFHTPPALPSPAGPEGVPSRSQSAGPGRQRPASLVTDVRGPTHSHLMRPPKSVIPRDCGLYGQDPPLAEFKLASPDSPTHLEAKSDQALRHDALVMDVIKSINEVVLYFKRRAEASGMCQTNGDIPLAMTSSQDSDDWSTGGGEGGPLSLIGPLRVLVCDGLLPSPKPIFSSRPRSRLWLLIEESCRPGTANRVLVDVFREVKLLPTTLTEKTKFRAFVSACLNAKALHMWISSLVANEPFLRRYYSPDAFMRQRLTPGGSTRDLLGSLLSTLELLLPLPFRLDVTGDVRHQNRPTGVSNKPIRGRHDIKPSKQPIGKAVVSTARLELSATSANENMSSASVDNKSANRSRITSRRATTAASIDKVSERTLANQNDSSTISASESLFTPVSSATNDISNSNVSTNSASSSLSSIQSEDTKISSKGRFQSALSNVRERTESYLKRNQATVSAPKPPIARQLGSKPSRIPSPIRPAFKLRSNPNLARADSN